MTTLHYHIPDQAALNAACLAFIIRGGLFFKTKETYSLGATVLVNLRLLDELETLDFSAKVVWLTPRYESDQMPEGVGVQFCEEDAKRVRLRIEALLPEAFSLSASMDFFG